MQNNLIKDYRVEKPKYKTQKFKLLFFSILTTLKFLKNLEKVSKKTNTIKIEDKNLRNSLFFLFQSTQLIFLIVKIRIKVAYLSKTCYKYYIKTITKKTIISQIIFSLKKIS